MIMRKVAPKLAKASRLIGPEDVRVGQYVTISEKTWQILCAAESACATGSVAEPRIGLVTGWPEEAGWPLRVVRVCLPYVFAQDSRGEHVAIDLRCHRLSRLSKSYGRAVFEAHKKPSPPAAQA